MRVKKNFDEKPRPRKFMKGDLVLLWDKRRKPKGAHGKLKSLWKGPYVIQELKGPNSLKLVYQEGFELPMSYNGQDLKLYQL